jgi:hypothetical protein
VYIILSAAPNSDFSYSNGRKAQVSIAPVVVPVTTIAGARAAACQFRDSNFLGGGNWTGGQVYNDNDQMIGHVSYNGRYHSQE